MDEELKKQLLDILKDVKTNASPAFQELVNQYSGLHLIYAIMLLASFVFSFIVVIKGLRYGIKFDTDMGASIFIVSSIGFPVSIILFISGCYQLGQSLYPLGNILGMLK